MPPELNFVLKKYSKPFQDAAKELSERVLSALKENNLDFSWLDESEDAVFIKNRQRVIVYANKELDRITMKSGSLLGKDSCDFATDEVTFISERSDRLIFQGALSLDIQFHSHGTDDEYYVWKTYKYDLSSVGIENYAILGITRPIEQIEIHNPGSDRQLELIHQKFVLLGEKDQEICKWTALGITSREIGEKLGMSSRAIEMRKQKVFEILNVSKSIELARKLVRLEERGMLDLNLDN